ncbi:unnamed protein product [Arabidopsis thaliana]|uniref:Prolamin-like domain-containing protein n=1 Tax=Arabidopsis thaliana TaxID=3702 RepID=A0A5S9X845_ARATH|nr:unnamed protein product [Arabidopsis thaliana]VYS55936.1 unnamed protein product [Arabidopsis thaliana]
MKLKQTKVMLFLLTLVFTLIFRPSEARLDPSLDPNHLCSDDETTPVANLPGCFYAVRLAADQDIRWLSRDCCEAVIVCHELSNKHLLTLTSPKENCFTEAWKKWYVEVDRNK